MSKRLKEKNRQRARRSHKVRSKIKGTTDRPRLSVSRSLKHISAQVIDDSQEKTIVSASEKDIKDVKPSKNEGIKIAIAKAVGMAIAKKATAKKVSEVVFDRGHYSYHGRVKAFAEGAREGGLKF